MLCILIAGFASSLDLRYAMIEPMFVHDNEHINIGSIIRSELKMQRKSVTWLANQLGTNRMTVYRIFSSISVDTSLLFRLSIILNKNFFEIYSNKLQSVKSDTQV